MNGGEGGIRTHVPVTRQHAFEARPLRPLRYLSVEGTRMKRTFDYTVTSHQSPATSHQPSALPALAEECLDQITAFHFAHARDDREAVIQPRQLATADRRHDRAR